MSMHCSLKALTSNQLPSTKETKRQIPNFKTRPLDRGIDSIISRLRTLLGAVKPQIASHYPNRNVVNHNQELRQCSENDLHRQSSFRAECTRDSIDDSDTDEGHGDDNSDEQLVLFVSSMTWILGFEVATYLLLVV